MCAKREVEAGRLGSSIDMTVSELIPGQLGWCILSRKQRDQVRMPRILPRCALFVVVSYDPSSHFGVYGELICHWKKEIVLTTVSFGQLRFSDAQAYALQRFGGVFRRVTGYIQGHEVIPLPHVGQTEHHQIGSDAGDDDDMDSDGWDEMPTHEGPEEFRMDSPADWEGEDEDAISDDNDELMVDAEVERTTEKINLLPMQSMRYLYKTYVDGLHNIKQERIAWGGDLEARVQEIRDRGLQKRTIKTSDMEDEVNTIAIHPETRAVVESQEISSVQFISRDGSHHLHASSWVAPYLLPC